MQSKNYVRIIESVGARKIWPPRRLHKKHLRLNEEFAAGKKLLVVVLCFPQQCLLEVRASEIIQKIYGGFLPYHFYELTERQVKKIAEAFLREDPSGELFNQRYGDSRTGGDKGRET